MTDLWTEVYRPAKIDDIILPKKIRKSLTNIVSTGEIPNMVFYGGPGVGKTTAALALINELNGSAMMINGSDDSGIESLRTKVREFASTASLSGGQKVVIYDEADALTAATQAALRGFIEEFASSCRFIFTCNNKNKLIEPLQDRLVSFDFTVPYAEMEVLQAKMFQRLCNILDENGVEYDVKVISAFVKSHDARWRRMLSELQQYAKSGKIDTGILTLVNTETFHILIQHLRNKDFGATQKWVVENGGGNQAHLIRKFYDQMRKVVTPNSIPGLVMILNSWQYKAAFVADQEINAVDHLTEIMKSLEFQNG